jgi:hypothetical protein
MPRRAQRPSLLELRSQGPYLSPQNQNTSVAPAAAPQPAVQAASTRLSFAAWIASRAYLSAQNENTWTAAALAPTPMPAAQTATPPLAIWRRQQPFQSKQNRLSLQPAATVLIPLSADVGALDSAVAGAGLSQTRRRTDTKIIRLHWHKKPEQLAAVAAAKPVAADLVAQLRDMRLEALWLSGAITDDEYFALRQAA